MLLVIGLSLTSAAAFAVSANFKHTSAGQVPLPFAAGDRSLTRFIRATLTHPLWRKGIAIDAVGLTLQAVALHLGALALVQPLLLSGLVFALLIRLGTPGAVRLRELGWAAVLVAAISGLLVLIGATSGAATSANASPAILTAAAGVLVVAVCVVFGGRHQDHRLAGPVLGAAVAIAYAGAAALLKAVTNLISQNPFTVVSSWQLYALIVVGAAGLLLNQMAFQTGPMTSSLPTTSALDPLFSVALGVVIFHERIQLGVGRDVGLVVLLVLLSLAILRLAAGSSGHVEPFRAGYPGAEPRELLARW
jgi:drug/metabolite transporter (DMT)-like permease